MALTQRERAGLWLPTDRQQRFRHLAELLWFDGQAGITTALRACRLLSLGIQPDPQSRLSEAIEQGMFSWQGVAVSIREYKGWEKLEGFLDWWSDAFPAVQGPTKTDMMQADGLYWASLVQGLAAGERSHMMIYAQAKLAAQKIPEQEGTLSGHFEEPDDVKNGWLE